jgi:hypothetical protein
MSRAWLLVVSTKVYEAERLYANEVVRTATAGAQPGECVAVLAESGPLFALGVVAPGGVRYTRRLFDQPVAAEDLFPTSTPGELAPLDPATYAELSRRAYGAAPHSRRPLGEAWLVSLALPIEASTPGEAVREFWSYVAKLGPRELPAFVSPARDELAMRAYVLGAETELDPEEAQ